MKDSDRRYIIGIDLGTTNSAVSYIDLQAEYREPTQSIKLFKVPQLIGAGEFSALPVLPSFLYIPGEYDISKEAITIPWETEDENFAGTFARNHGAKVPARLVSSAKSWLCHSNADRHARILPWGAGEEIYKVSPVQATAYYLKHIKKAWNTAQGDDADSYLENQIIIITVPASFDEVARDLTLEAALMAGLNGVTLLEEPLAAFYNWLIRHEHHWNELVRPGELILVCDVGGGTSDFTLITLREVDGSPRFERIAVGDHLILGGDNIDLTLARQIESKFSKKKLSLTPDRLKALSHQCREAKELILNHEAESKRITIMGEGKKLILGTLSAELKRKEVEETVLEGFFPLVDYETEVKKANRKGITEFGLPYEQEPAITRHIGWFLERHKADVKRILNRDNYAPDLILFNGGSLKSEITQERIKSAIRHWFDIKDTNLPRVLENLEPDLAVALGASYYGLVKIGQGVRVGSGSARSFYLGITEANSQQPTAKDQQPTAKRQQPAAKDQQPTAKKAICIVERGLEEGTRIELKEMEFEVLANQLVSFDLFSSSFRAGDRCGDLVETDDSLTPLPPLRTVVQYGKKGTKTSIPVQIEATYTEVGTLALWCRSGISDHRWRLQFQLRGSAPSVTRGGVSDKNIFDESVIEMVGAKVREAFVITREDIHNKEKRDLLVKDVSDIVEKKREKWSMGLIRSMADELLEFVPVSNITYDYESRWLNLTGFCLRPGFGDGFDEHRIRRLWKIYKRGPIHANNAQVRSEWWILWRRVAGGLKAGQQRQFIQDLTPMMLTRKGSKTKIPHQEYLEIWMAVANMELLLAKDKIKWGRQLISELDPGKSKPQLFWSLSRLGARELLYGPVDRVIPSGEISSWIETLSEKEWHTPKPVGNALLQMARKTGDRMRDIDISLAARVADWLAMHDFSDSQINLLKKSVPMEKQEQSMIFGESLPSGLVLRG